MGVFFVYFEGFRSAMTASFLESLHVLKHVTEESMFENFVMATTNNNNNVRVEAARSFVDKWGTINNINKIVYDVDSVLTFKVKEVPNAELVKKAPTKKNPVKKKATKKKKTTKKTATKKKK